jgi:hypothetical protein
MTKYIKQIIITCFFALNSIQVCLADMPKTECNSICIDAKNLPPGAHCITLDKYNFYYRTLGTGNPTIIFSSGTGFPSEGWYESNIANVIAEKTRVITYDRIYTFNSCPNQNNFMPVTAVDAIHQLRQLLAHENLKPPYILVGQSFGGLYMLLYARMFPNEVAGLLLMDASSDAGPTPLPKEAKKILERLGNPQNPIPENQLYNEMIGQLPSYLQSKTAPPLQRDIPLIVMYATKHCLPKVWTKKLMCMSPSQEENHKQNQLKIYNMSDIHEFIRVDGDHMSFFSKEKNQLVMKALNDILIMAGPRVKKLSN